MRLSVYLGLLHSAESTLAAAFRQIAEGHGHEPDVHFLCLTLAAQCDQHVDALAPVLGRYGQANGDDEPERLHAEGLTSTRSGPLGLLRDLQDVFLLASMVDVTWSMIGQAGRALRDAHLLNVTARCSAQTGNQVDWIRSRMSQAAPQTLIATD